MLAAIGITRLIPKVASGKASLAAGWVNLSRIAPGIIELSKT